MVIMMMMLRARIAKENVSKKLLNSEHFNAYAKSKLLAVSNITAHTRNHYSPITMMVYILSKNIIVILILDAAICVGKIISRRPGL